jgi:hypothetical protein
MCQRTNLRLPVCNAACQRIAKRTATDAISFCHILFETLEISHVLDLTRTLREDLLYRNVGMICGLAAYVYRKAII